MKQSGLPADMVREDDIEQIITSMALDLKLETMFDQSLDSVVGAGESMTLYKAANWAYAGAFPSWSPVAASTLGGDEVAYVVTVCGKC